MPEGKYYGSLDHHWLLALSICLNSLSIPSSTFNIWPSEREAKNGLQEKRTEGQSWDYLVLKMWKNQMRTSVTFGGRKESRVKRYLIVFERSSRISHKARCFWDLSMVNYITFWLHSIVMPLLYFAWLLEEYFMCVGERIQPLKRFKRLSGRRFHIISELAAGNRASPCLALI